MEKVFGSGDSESIIPFSPRARQSPCLIALVNRKRDAGGDEALDHGVAGSSHAPRNGLRPRAG
jgi:hypothetical protein